VMDGFGAGSFVWKNTGIVNLDFKKEIFTFFFLQDGDRHKCKTCLSVLISEIDRLLHLPAFHIQLYHKP
jgi:hypothetical protein